MNMYPRDGSSIGFAIIILVLGIAALGLVFLNVREAGAQMVCSPLAALERALRDTHKEEPQWVGRVTSPDGSAAMHLFITVAPDGKWTAYMRGERDGVKAGCIMLTGTEGQSVDVKKTVH